MNKQQRLQDISDNPNSHYHVLADLIDCCKINGAVDIELMDAHSKYVDLGTNGGTQCDVISGPCSCGAWH